MSSALRCLHKGETFQACIQLILKHFKLKLCVKIENLKPLNFTGHIQSMFPNPPATFPHLRFATVWGLAIRPA